MRLSILFGMRGARRIAVLALVASLAGCATTFNHPVQTVAIAPQLQGGAAGDSRAPVGLVRVLITTGMGTYRATLPTRFVITPDTWVHARVQVVEPCFRPTEQTLPRSVTPWIWGDAVGLAVTAGAAGVFAFGGDGLDGTMWSYDREAKVQVEPVADYSACVTESRKRPGEPFPVSPDPVWQDPRDYSKLRRIVATKSAY